MPVSDLFKMSQVYEFGLLNTIIKPRPARQVNLGFGLPGDWTGSSLLKDQPVQQSGKTRLTRVNPNKTRCFFCLFSNEFFSYTLFFHIFLVGY
jgi:hypothetical protein